MQLIGVKIDVKETWKIAEDREKGKEIVRIRIEEVEKKKEIWEKKSRLIGRKKRGLVVLEDWIWKQRRMRWKLKEIARMEEKKGKKIWIEYGKIRRQDQW